ncbi:hypothetical protein EV643_1567 [Kribbella sp. VKM Ac-2527]|uniref:Uncharacterized protein n=1 Tax=Kribbella caucasensis TaxID=2512215 RepID=A0A4R6IXP0_9ACTN|nr:hypothetical protein EV643_1567 [Kribbella sp. VKM Ac-2527]
MVLYCVAMSVVDMSTTARLMPILIWLGRGCDTVAMGNLPPGLAGAVQLELARAAERLPGDRGSRAGRD